MTSNHKYCKVDKRNFQLTNQEIEIVESGKEITVDDNYLLFPSKIDQVWTPTQ